MSPVPPNGTPSNPSDMHLTESAQGEKVQSVDWKEGQEKRGRLFVVSAPSGAGKTTLCAKMLKRFSHLSYSISHTTRPPRAGEKDGVEYYFITADAFKERIDNDQWVEWAKVHENYYGTSKEVIEKGAAEGNHLLLDIDVQGARQVKAIFPEAITLFIMPPSLSVLEERLRKRGTDADAVIKKRIANAEGEMAQKDFYQHVIVNDDLAQAEKEMTDIFAGYLSTDGLV